GRVGPRLRSTRVIGPRVGDVRIRDDGGRGGHGRRRGARRHRRRLNSRVVVLPGFRGGDAPRDTAGGAAGPRAPRDPPPPPRAASGLSTRPRLPPSETSAMSGAFSFSASSPQFFASNSSEPLIHRTVTAGAAGGTVLSLSFSAIRAGTV